MGAVAVVGGGAALIGNANEAGAYDAAIPHYATLVAGCRDANFARCSLIESVGVTDRRKLE